MRSRALLLTSLLLCWPVVAQRPGAWLPDHYRDGPHWLEFRFEAAEVVVDAMVQDVRTAGFEREGGSRNCGYVHVATIRESFKGGYSGTVTFATKAPLMAGSRYLLFLSNRQNETLVYSGQDRNTLRAEATCREGLPALSTWNNDLGAQSWSLEESPEGRTLIVLRADFLPDSEITRFTTQTGERRQAIEWPKVRMQLLDQRPGDVRLAHEPASLEQASEIMQEMLSRNLRASASQRELIAAIQRSQRAWTAFQQAICSPFTVVPDSFRGAPPPQQCMLELASRRIQELESLAHTADWYHFRPNCDDACWANLLKTGRQEVYEHLAGIADNFVILPKLEVSATASRRARKTWEAWADASCQMLTIRWPDRRQRSSLLDRCYLHAIETWGQMMRDYHFEDGGLVLKQHLP